MSTAVHSAPDVQPVAPERSLAQRLDALQKANRIRGYRAAIKRSVAAGRLEVVDLLTGDDELLDTMKVWDLLIAQPKRGRVKVNRLLMNLRISPSKTIGGLSPRQRNELQEHLR